MPAILGLLVVWLLLPFQGQEAWVQLKNGKAVNGKILEEKPSFIVLETDVGQLLIKKEKIEKIERRLPGVPPSPAGTEGETTGVPAAPGGASPDKGDQQATKTPEKIPEEKPQLRTEQGTEGETEGKPDADRPPQSEGSKPIVVEKGQRRRSRSPTYQRPRNRLWHGRLMDRYTWVFALSLSSKITVIALLFGFVWGCFQIGGKIVGMELLTLGRSAAAALIWVALLVAVLLIPDPDFLIVFVVGGLLLLCWFLTGRKILAASWFQTCELFAMFFFELAVLTLLIEVGESLLAMS